MWDEQERFAAVVSKSFAWLLAALGVVLAVASLAAGSLVPLLAYLQILAYLAAVVLGYGLAAVCLGGALLGISCGASRCLHWLGNRRSERPVG